MDDNYEDYRDFNDMDYNTALNILQGGATDQGNFYPKPQQVQQQQHVIPGMDYNTALSLLKEPESKKNESRGTSEKEPPSVSNRAMASFLHQQSPLGPTKNYDPEAKNLSPIENLGIGIMDYSPYLIGASGALKAAGSKAPALASFLARNPKTAMLAENALGSTASGAVNNGIAGALTGLATAPIASIGGAAMGGLTNLAAKKYAQSAIPEFIQKSTEKLRELLPESLSKALTGKYIMANVKNNQNWQKTNSLAENLSNEMAQSGKQFNAEPYHGYIDTYLQKMSKLSPAQREPYQNAIAFAQQAKELAPTSFSDLVALRQNLNGALKNFENKLGRTQTDRNSQQFVKDLKDKLSTDLIEKNAGNISEDALNTFKNQWENANKSHQDVQQFYKSLSPTGTIKPMRSTREAYEAIKGGAPMDTALIGKYMPKPQQTGIEGFKQLEQLYGSKEAAQDAAKSFLFRRPSEQGANTVDVAAIYSKLSPAQRNYIFGGSKEGQMLESANQARLAFGREPERDFWKKGAHSALSFGVPGALGFGAGIATGHPWEESVGFGAGLAGLSKGGGYLAGKTATPYLANAAKSLAKRPMSAGFSKALNTLMQQRGGGNQ